MSTFETHLSLPAGRKDAVYDLTCKIVMTIGIDPGEDGGNSSPLQETTWQQLGHRPLKGDEKTAS